MSKQFFVGTHSPPQKRGDQWYSRRGSQANTNYFRYGTSSAGVYGFCGKFPPPVKNSENLSRARQLFFGNIVAPSNAAAMCLGRLRH